MATKIAEIDYLRTSTASVCSSMEPTSSLLLDVSAHICDNA